MLAGLICLAYLKIKSRSLLLTPEGIKYAIYAGIFVGLAEILSFYFLSLGVSASRGIPIVIDGSILVSTILGLVVLKENLSATDWIGILLIVSGVLMLTAKKNVLTH